MSVVRAPSGELAPREGIAYASKASFYMCNLTLVLGSLYREYSILEQMVVGCTECRYVHR